MNWKTMMIVSLTLCLAACAKKPEAEEESAEPAAAAQDSMPAESMEWQNEALLAHMHEHADQLDNLNFALADDDLMGAMTPAYWLSRHEGDSGFPERFQTYVEGMRQAARAVETAPDLDSAKAAAERITVECQGCHEEAGVDRE